MSVSQCNGELQVTVHSWPANRAAVPSYTLFSTHYIHKVENGGKTRGKQITFELVSVAYTNLGQSYRQESMKT